MLVRFLASPYLMLVLLLLLGVSAGVATFVENDFGTLTAREFFYESWWFGTLLGLTCIHILVVVAKRKMWKNPWRFILHFAFLFILVGAFMTHFLGVEGTLRLEPNETKNSFIGTKPHLHVRIKTSDESTQKTFPLPINAWGSDFETTIRLNSKPILIKLDSARVEKQGLMTQVSLGIHLQIDDALAQFELKEHHATLPIMERKKIDDFEISLGYGPIEHPLPFYVGLGDFELVYYPGGYAPATYKSKVVVEGKGYIVGMNEPLRKGGYAFSQSSYEGNASILWVNQNTGKWPTYFGYALLFMGLILNLFDPSSRIRHLARKVRKLEATLGIVLVCTVLPLQGSEYEGEYLENLRANSVSLAKEWGTLVVQTKAGRMKPLDTLSREIVRKLTGSENYERLSANQVVLGMFTHQRLWKRLPLIKVKTEELRERIGVPKGQRLAKFEDFFTGTTYKLELLVNMALKKPQKERSQFEKDLIEVDERLNVALMTFYGTFFKIFPDVQNPEAPWRSIDMVYKNPLNEKEHSLERVIIGFMDRVFERNFENATKQLVLMKRYANTHGSLHMPNPLHVKLEIMLNELAIFPKLISLYLIIGLVSLGLGFAQIIRSKAFGRYVNWLILGALGVGFVAHTLGIVGRWIVSGFVPLSNTYESIVYIGWSCALAGLVLFRRSLFGLGAALCLAGVFMFVAHLGSINPDITPLVPVLNSFWLSVHVSVITASYGFLGVGAVLAVVVLALYALMGIFKVKSVQIDYLTFVNEIALLAGLTLLVIGNFLGGVWANESWGRYWGWDPKETWTFVAIVAYALITHMRFIPKIYSPLNFALASVLGSGTILMTFFVVNFYLACLHSYAKGDPVPIPTWVYVCIVSIIVLYLLALKNRNKIIEEKR